MEIMLNSKINTFSKEFAKNNKDYQIMIRADLTLEEKIEPPRFTAGMQEMANKRRILDSNDVELTLNRVIYRGYFFRYEWFELYNPEGSKGS